MFTLRVTKLQKMRLIRFVTRVKIKEYSTLWPIHFWQTHNSLEMTINAIWQSLIDERITVHMLVFSKMYRKKRDTCSGSQWSWHDIFEKIVFFVRVKERRIFLYWTTTVCHSERFNFSDPLRHERPIHNLQYQVKDLRSDLDFLSTNNGRAKLIGTKECRHWRRTISSDDSFKIYTQNTWNENRKTSKNWHMDIIPITRRIFSFPYCQNWVKELSSITFWDQESKKSRFSDKLPLSYRSVMYPIMKRNPFDQSRPPDHHVKNIKVQTRFQKRSGRNLHNWTTSTFMYIRPQRKSMWNRKTFKQLFWLTISDVRCQVRHNTITWTTRATKHRLNRITKMIF